MLLRMRLAAFAPNDPLLSVLRLLDELLLLVFPEPNENAMTDFTWKMSFS